MPKTKIVKKILGIGVITAMITGLMAGVILVNPLEKWQLKLSNRLYNRNEPHPEIIIAGIDDRSLDSENGLGLWGTWDRKIYATAIENLEKKGAKVIAIDILFLEKSKGLSEESLKEILLKNGSLEKTIIEIANYIKETHPSDTILAETLKKYNNIILAKRDLQKGSKEKVVSFYPLEVFRQYTKMGGTIIYPDSDDVIRRIPPKLYDLNEKTWENHFSLEAANLYQGKIHDIDPYLTKDNDLLINYAGPPLSYKTISFLDVYSDEFEKENVNGKIVLIGAISERTKDAFVTPTSPSTPMPGVEVHANAIQTILEGKFLTEQTVLSQILAIALLTLLITTLVMVLGILPGLFVAMTSIIGYQLAAEPLFDRGLILNLVYPPLALFLAYLSTTLYKYFTESRDRTQLKTAFSKYVNKELVNQILDHPEMLKLGGEKRTITVFFSDIANFTHVSESMSAENLVAQLNDYFEVMTSIILKNGGTLNKFEGDAIMAFWGAPVDQPDHALRAAQSTLECRLALRSLHEKWTRDGKPLLDFRVGLATGEVIAGNVGSKERFDYTVMGDIVNLGSRLESANKVYGTHVMVSDQTHAALQELFEMRNLDRLRVKGKDQSVEVYELLSAKGQLSLEQQQIIQAFHEALQAYQQGQFEQAEQQFTALSQKVPHDGPTQTYLERCRKLKANPPKQWDGIWVMESK